jgi:transposase
MRPKGMTKLELEARRLAAVKMVESGMAKREVARRLECAPSAVMKWTKMYAEGGRAALTAIPEEGKQQPAYLDDADRKRLEEFLLAGPLAAGFRTELWTLSRIRDLIEREFGVRYSVGHVFKIVTGLGFTSQKPEKRAREQDPEKVRDFRNRTWARLKKSPNAKAGRSSSSTSPRSC